jgi:hypothetical protein
MGNKSGVLAIDADDTVCRIWFRDGAPVHAESAKQQGFDAAVSAVNVERGRFHFDPGTVDRESTISCSVPQLLLEACRQLDEENA